jgi:iron-sulfur cluster repair protein YtfE (RIC family)
VATELKPFITEHARLRAGIARIRQTAGDLEGLDPEQRRRRIMSVLRFLEGPLARHADAEEAALYPFVARQLRHPAAAAPMVFDHELIRGYTRELSDAEPDDLPRLRELLYGLYATVDAHFQKEERFYLPVLAGAGRTEQILASMEAIALGRREESNVEQKLGPHGFPLSGRKGEKLAWAVTYAILAPSSHNSQPWRFVVRGDELELRADRTRALPVVDPHDRELLISCGAALFHLRAALRKAGEIPVVELLPEPEDADLLARVGLTGERRAASLAEKQLFWSMRKRQTNRRRYGKKSVPGEVLSALGRAAADEDTTFVVLAGAQREGLADLVAAADRQQAGDPSFRRELASWLHPNRTHARDGMPGYAFGKSGLASAVGPLVVRTFDWGRGRAAKDEQLALGSPVLALLTTRGDETADWLAAGQALAHVLLRATIDDVVASFLNQPVEVDALRGRLAGIVGAGVPQLVLRLGYACAVRPTLRRPVEDVLDYAS